MVQACAITISVPKTKFLVAVTQSDLDPIHNCGSAIDSVSSFQLIPRVCDSVMECHGGGNAEVTARASRATTIFRAL